MIRPILGAYRFARDRLQLLVDALRTSFWLLPVILMAVAVLLAMIVIWLDSHVFPDMTVSSSDWWAVTELDSIRSLLSTTAASVLGVAGVSFSITIASLTLASQQFGPRLIRTFMQDRFTQFVLGVFVSTFLFCMINIHLSSVAVADNYRPVATLIAVMVLTVLNLLLLVLFIHRIAVSIQVDSVIEEVAREIDAAIERLPEREAEVDRLTGAVGQPATCPDLLANQGILPLHTLPAPRSGYIQLLDREGLLETARTSDVTVHVPHCIGEHVLAGEPLLHVYPAVRPVDGRDASASAPADRSEQQAQLNSLAGEFVIGRTRTPVQDLLFPVKQLVEIALRALSPGINDPYTALNCLDRLAEFLAQSASRRLGDVTLVDSDGVVRAYLSEPDFSALLDTCFTRIARCGHDNADVLRRILNACRSLSQTNLPGDCRESINHFVIGMRAAIEEAPLIEAERSALVTACDRFPYTPPL